jgi:hypothetical protein
MAANVNASWPVHNCINQCTASFDDWWDTSSNAVAVHLRKGLNSITILGAWTLWNIRNRCVFDAESPKLARALLLTSEELIYWSLEGA